MSLQFSDTTAKRGIVQEIEKELGFNYGDVSGNTELLKEVTSLVNLSLDDFWAIALPASGKWQLDDSNNTDYPIITANLVSGQRDYSFTVDGSSNIILDIYKVMVADANGVFREVSSVDQQGDTDMSTFYDGQNATGTPVRHDKTANGIFLDPVPNYNYTGGVKVFINREASYFVYTDTTDKPGVTGIFHRYFVLNPALTYARRNNLASHNRIQQELLKMEAAIKYHYAGRERGVRRAIVPNVEDTR